VNWRAAALALEAWRNVTVNAVRSLVLGALIAAACGVLAFLELRQAEDISAFQRNYTAAGGYVAIVTMQDRSLGTARCAAVAHWPGVAAAGPVTLTGTVSFTSAPGLFFQSAAITAGTAGVWAPDALIPAAAAGGYLAGPALADELGIQPGSFLALDGESPAPLVAILSSSRRNPQSARWLLDLSAPTGPTDECWIEFERDSYQAGLAALASWFSRGSHEPVVRPYLRNDEFTRDPAAEFAKRPQRWGWVPGGGLLGALFLLAAWFRRAELGLYLAIGTPRLELAVLLAVEALIVTGLGATTGMAWALAAGRILNYSLPWDHTAVAMVAGGSAALLGAALAPWLQAIVVRGNVAALLKER
jgi:hypothetical protein